MFSLTAASFLLHVTNAQVRPSLHTGSTSNIPSSVFGADPFARVSEGCQQAIAAANSSTTAACPNALDSVSRWSAQIESACVAGPCQQQLNNFADALTSGACSTDAIGISIGTVLSSDILVAAIGYYLKAKLSILCQKTSDNKGYCLTSQEYGGLFGLLAETTIYRILGSANSTSIVFSISTPSLKSVICSDCSKNALLMVRTIPNLSPQSQSVLKNVSSQFSTFCRDTTLTTVPGTNAALGYGSSLGLSLALIFAVFTMF